MVTRRTWFAAAPALTALLGQDADKKMFGNAEAYEKFMGRWSRAMAPLFVDFAGVPSTGRVLDVGSGTGALAHEIGRRHPRVHVTGIDPSDEYVAYANRGNPHPDRIRFEKGDAQGLAFGDGSFAASVSLLVFNFIPDAAKALAELRRVTTPGARVSAAVWDYGGRMQMLRTFWDAAAAIDPGAGKLDEKHMPLCRAGDLSRLWRQAGLENVHEQPLEISTRFAGFGDYWEPFLLGQGPAGAYVRKLSPPQSEALRAEVKRRLGLAAETAAFTLPARVWAVRGTVPSR